MRPRKKHGRTRMSKTRGGKRGGVRGSHEDVESKKGMRGRGAGGREEQTGRLYR